MLIHVFRDGEEMGPFTAAQVTEMMADGRLSPKDMAWTEGLHEWTQLSALVPAPVKTKEPKDSIT